MSSVAPVLASAARVAAVRVSDPSLRARLGAALAGGGIEISGSAESHVVVIAGDRSAGRRAGILRSLRGAAAVVMIVPAGAGRLRDTLDAGAAGIVLESDIETALVPTVLAVAAGQVVLPSRRRTEIDRPALSHREKQALLLAASGLTNSEIATRLYVTESTVKGHLTSVFTKLGVHSRAEAAALALDPQQAQALGLTRVWAAR